MSIAISSHALAKKLLELPDASLYMRRTGDLEFIPVVTEPSECVLYELHQDSEEVGVHPRLCVVIDELEEIDWSAGLFCANDLSAVEDI